MDTITTEATTERVTINDVADRMLDLFDGIYEGREGQASGDVEYHVGHLNIEMDAQGTMAAPDARRIVGALVSDFIGLP